MLHSIIDPYINLALSLLIIAVAISLLFWTLAPLSLIRFLPEQLRKPAAGLALILLVAALVQYIGALPKDLVRNLEWRATCVEDPSGWNNLVQQHHSLAAFGLEKAHLLQPSPDDMLLPFIHGHLRIVINLDRWMISKMIVPEIIAREQSPSWSGAIGSYGIEVNSFIYGFLWRKFLPWYFWFSPFIIGLFGVGFLFLLEVQPSHRKIQQAELNDGIFGLLPITGISITTIILLSAIPYKPSTWNSVERTETIVAEVIAENELNETVTILEIDGITETSAIIEPEIEQEIIEQEPESEAIEWPERVEVHDYSGRAELHGSPDLYDDDIVAHAYDDAMLSLLENAAVCGPDQGLWLHVRIDSDPDLEADPRDRGTTGWVAVQDVSPHHYGCCGDRNYDCVPWPEMNPENFEEIPITTTEATVRSRANVRFTPLGHPRAHNRAFRLRGEHPVTIIREVCSPRGFRWAYIRFREEQERDGRIHSQNGWVYRPSLTPNADGCCLGRTGADPSCRDGADVF